MDFPSAATPQDSKTCVEVEETYWVGNLEGHSFQVRKFVEATYGSNGIAASRTVGSTWHAMVSTGNQLCITPDGVMRELLTGQKLVRIGRSNHRDDSTRGVPGKP